MLEYLVIVGFALTILSAVFMIGYFVGLSDALNIIEDPEEQIYCFECENETTAAIAKNGRAYCTNCKLYN